MSKPASRKAAFAAGGQPFGCANGKDDLGVAVNGAAIAGESVSHDHHATGFAVPLPHQNHSGRRCELLLIAPGEVGR